MVNNANYLSQLQHKVVNISHSFRQTSYPSPPLIFYPLEEMFSMYYVHQHTVFVVFVDVITKKTKDYTAALLPVTLAWKSLGATIASVNREPY